MILLRLITDYIGTKVYDYLIIHKKKIFTKL